MKLFDHPLDETDLIAYHLHELSPRRQRSLHRILQESAALAAESEAIAATLRAFPKEEAAFPVDAETRERTWLALLPSLTIHLPKPVARFRLWRKWTLPVLAGSAFAATAVLVSLHYSRHARPSTVATIGTHSSTVPTLSPSPDFKAAVPSNAPNAFNCRAGRTAHVRASSFAPIKINNPTISLNVPSAESLAPAAPAPFAPAQPFPVQPSPAEAAPALNSIIQTASAASPSSATKPRTPSAVGRRFSFPRPYMTELTLAIFADLTAPSSSSSTAGAGTSLITKSNSQTASPAVGALASFHQQFRPWLGYRLTATYFHPTFNYASTPAGTPSGNGLGIVNTQVYEFGGAYVVQGPHRRRLTTSVEGGASLLDFVPYVYQSQTTSIRAAGIVGVGAEYAVTKRLALSAEYRAQIYKGPAFSDTNVTGTFATTNTVFSSNPIVGITYRFGAKNTD